MKRIASVVLFLLAYQLNIFSQETGSFERKPYTLKVLVDKKTFYEEELKSSPFIYPDNTLQLYPGETVYIEVEVVNDSISKMIPVAEIRDSSKTLTVKFTQEINKKVHQIMMLEVENPLPYQLTYTAIIYLLNHKKWVKTSTVPVLPGLASFESWPDIITSIGLKSWKLEK